MKTLLGVFTCADNAAFPLKGPGALQADSLKLCGVTSGPGMNPGSDTGIPCPSVRGFMYAWGSGPAEPRRTDWLVDLLWLSSVFEAAGLGSRVPQPWKREISAGPPGSAERRGVRRGSTEWDGGANTGPRMLSPTLELVDWGASLGRELPKSSSTVICFTTEWPDCGEETKIYHLFMGRSHTVTSQNMCCKSSSLSDSSKATKLIIFSIMPFRNSLSGKD